MNQVNKEYKNIAQISKYSHSGAAVLIVVFNIFYVSYVLV